MPPSTAARLTRQIALGLEHAHRKGLIHRDVNPYNILVTHDGIAKLADLGLAIDLAEEERVTREGATVGTFDYVAPEQARHSHSADIRSDIYSLGCTLYHMIAGQVPFPSPSLPEKLFAHQALEPTPLDQMVPDVPAGLVEVVQRMMRKLPDERYATPLQVAQALEPFVEEYARMREGEPEPEPLAVDQTSGPSPLPRPGGAEGAGHFPGALGPLAKSPGVPTAPESRPMAASGLHGDQPGVGTPGSGFEANRPAIIAPSVLTPVNGDELSETEDIPLILDLGPEPALTDSLTRPRSWFGGERPAKAVPGTADFPPGEAEPSHVLSRGPGLLLDRPWSWGIAALLAAIMLLLVAYVLTRWFASPQSQASVVGRPRLAVPKKAEARPEPSIVVLKDGVETPAPDLSQAVSLAVGSKGAVILRNREPLRLTMPEAAISLLTDGYLTIRAGDGTSPVLVVDMKGQPPFMTTAARMDLTLEGLTIVARYADQPPGTTPAPIIHSAGKAGLRHCTFRVENGPNPAGYARSTRMGAI